jgi:hypothetical protein
MSSEDELADSLADLAEIKKRYPREPVRDIHQACARRRLVTMSWTAPIRSAPQRLEMNEDITRAIPSSGGDSGAAVLPV